MARIFAVDPLADPEPLVRRVYSHVAYRIGGGPDAEDVTSDVFEQALRYRDGYDPSKGEPAAWLIGIARRRIEIPRRWVTASPDEDVAALGDLEEEAVRRLTLSAAVAKLNERERERELIALRYGADLSARQIGELLGERTNTIEVALHRVLGRLRSLLAEDPEEIPARAVRI